MNEIPPAKRATPARIAPTGPLIVHVDHSAFPDVAQARLAAELSARRVPAGFLYESPAQATRWLAYHQAWSPSRRDGDVVALYRTAFRAAAGALPRGPLTLVGIGCGGGQKDREAIAALLATPARHPSSLCYVPLDVSPHLVLRSALAVRAGWPDLALHPVMADLSARPGLRALLPPGAGAAHPLLLSALGMLPNAEPVAFAAWLASLLTRGDFLLVSANLTPRGFAADRDAIVAQYDNAEARAWYLGALAELGIAPDRARLTIRGEPMSENGGYWRVVVEAELNDALVVATEAASTRMELGERLFLFHSNRFTFEAAQTLLTDAGLSVEEAWRDGTGEEGVFLCCGARN